MSETTRADYDALERLSRIESAKLSERLIGEFMDAHPEEGTSAGAALSVYLGMTWCAAVAVPLLKAVPSRRRDAERMEGVMQHAIEDDPAHE